MIMVGNNLQDSPEVQVTEFPFDTKRWNFFREIQRYVLVSTEEGK